MSLSKKPRTKMIKFNKLTRDTLDFSLSTIVLQISMPKLSAVNNKFNTFWDIRVEPASTKSTF